MRQLLSDCFGRDAALRRPRLVLVLWGHSTDGAARRPYRSKSLQKRLPTGPGVVAGLFVFGSAGGRFAVAHETVAGALVNDRLIFLAGGFHQLLGLRDR